MTKTKIVKVDRKTWQEVEKALPKMSNKKRSKILFDYSIVKVEKVLEDADFKDSLGSFLYGKKNWKKIKR